MDLQGRVHNRPGNVIDTHRLFLALFCSSSQSIFSVPLCLCENRLFSSAVLLRLSGLNAFSSSSRVSRHGSISDRILRCIFHAMENFFAVFPRYGKFLREFSTLWKTFFHTVENGAGPADHAPRRRACGARRGGLCPRHRLRVDPLPKGPPPRRRRHRHRLPPAVFESGRPRRLGQARRARPLRRHRV